MIESLLPPWSEKSAGCQPVADRLCLQGILYVLQNDLAWQLLPLELEFGSGQTCWRRLDRWRQAGVFDRLHRILLAELNTAGELDRSRACVDGPGRQGKLRIATPSCRDSLATSTRLENMAADMSSREA
ncbi:transposase [Streptomyces sp. NBC_00696]|uniref:transposase n=1 Tax=Streptomyces sp. NBC_00696 TaxID=2903672 RepID=UPI002E313CCC|nr:transposase [Streptomyces sp. NBC_00696]